MKIQWRLLLGAVASWILPAVNGMTAEEKCLLKEEAKSMFYHGYNNYMKHAFPWDELKPLSCAGRRWDRRERGTLDDSLGGFSLTLIDSLGTLAVMGDYDEFGNSVQRVIDVVTFDRDVDVSVFESTIRVVGGLLSAHMLASSNFVGLLPKYNNELLDMAIDLGNRLMPAFDTPTGIPRHRVNLRHGNIVGETYETCTAAGGSLLLEFAVLSRLSGIKKFEKAARAAVKAIWKRRSKHNLVGSTLNTATGQWVHSTSGIGAGLDSFYEYLLKYYVMFGDAEWLSMFNQSYAAIETHMKHGDWHFPVDMNHGRHSIISHRISALQAFWPGLQVLAGDVESATKSHRKFDSLWRRFEAIPEVFDLASQGVISWAKDYPLRPEFAESTYHLYQATRDPQYLEIGKRILFNLQNHTKVECGYASVADVHTKRLDDRMDSFFLSETCKYLYLLFSSTPDTIINAEIPVSGDRMNCAGNCSSGRHIENTTTIRIPHSQIVFTTEGHLFLLSPLFTKSTPRQSKRLSVADTQGAFCSAIPHAPTAKSMTTTTIGHEVEKSSVLSGLQSLLKGCIAPNKCGLSEIVPAGIVDVLSVSGYIRFIASPASFGKNLANDKSEVYGAVTVVGENSKETSFACSSLMYHTPPLSGRIALVRRGQCSFVTKARNVQQQGAVAMIIVDTRSGPSSTKKSFVVADDGSGADIRFPVVMVSAEDGIKLREAISAEEDVVVKLSSEARGSRLLGQDGSGIVWQNLRIALEYALWGKVVP